MPATNNANDNATNTAFLFGLPGKNIKVYQRSTPDTSPPTSHSTPDRSLKPALALGISLLDTDVSRHPKGHPKQIFPPRPPSGPSHGRDGSSDSLTVLRKRRGPLPSPLKLDKDLSPFDRYIPIALSVPAHTTVFNDGNDPRQRQLSPASANTPAIILTPTEDSHNPYGNRADPRRTILPPGRPPSSVYMRAISTFNRQYSPRRSRALAWAALRNSKGDPLGLFTRRRAASDVTIIDDESPCIVPYQKTPIALSKSHVRASVETVPPTPLRSNGWWNMFLSPIISRSNSTKSVKFSPVSSEDVPDLPILKHAAAIDGTSRGLDSNDTITQDKNSTSPATLSTFYMIPTLGEAAPYYDHLQDFSTPRLPDSTGQSGLNPSMPVRESSLHTLDTLDSASSQREVGYSPEPDTIHAEKPADPRFLDTRHIRAESVPDKTPPKSAMAEVFSPHEKETSDRDLLSPKSPSPVVGVASAAWFQSARAVQHTSTEPEPMPLPMPEARSHQSTLAKLTAPEPVLTQSPLLPLPRPPPPVDPSSGPSSSVNRSVAGPSNHPAERLPPPPPPKDYDEPLPRDLSPDTEAGPGFFGRLFRNTPDKSPPREATGTTEAKAGIVAKMLESDFMTTHYDSPPRPPRSEGASQKWWVKHALVLILLGALFLVVLLITLLALFVTQSHKDIPVESNWLNLTGFPPLPTGVSTVAQPSVEDERSLCVKPDGLWSCALPRYQQSTNVPNGAILPNFRLEIRFRNNTLASNLTQLTNTTLLTRSSTGPAVAGAVMRQRRDYFASLLYTPSPPPPALAEQVFLGNTTDNITSSNLAGEETPFYISLLSAAPLGALSPNTTMSKRALNTNDTSSIPSPALSSNGSAALGQLYPNAQSQPLKLYDRGLSSEHYGFYTYFDRSILYTLPSAIQVSSQSVSSNDSTLADDGGAVIGSANALCTFSQTRFLVKIWTNSGASRQVFATSSNSTANNAVSPPRVSNYTASAFDFATPGSFPWPITVSLDRHGGNGVEKGVYCYGVDDQGNVQMDAKAIIAEDRGAGGTLLSPTGGPFSASVWKDATGIDGGSGGCGCSWQNWS